MRFKQIRYCLLIQWLKDTVARILIQMAFQKLCLKYLSSNFILKTIIVALLNYMWYGLTSSLDGVRLRATKLV